MEGTMKRIKSIQLFCLSFFVIFLFVCSVFADSSSKLSFEQRVIYQRAIEEVYWKHNLWPDENPGSKPLFSQILREKDTQSKVQEYLRKSDELDLYQHHPITAKQMQVEMNRIARESKDPQLLREVWAALGNDPYLIAECFVRPILAERLTDHLSGADERSGHHQELSGLRREDSLNTYRLPEITARDSFDSSEIEAASTAPSGRYGHTAVWTGTVMIIWGGRDSTRFLDTGSRYNPSTNSWSPTSSAGAPAPRQSHTAVWTGTEMIIWGGTNDAKLFNSGARYNPSTNSWSATNLSRTPIAREGHTAVWTGTEMIIWGGSCCLERELDTGGRYNPSTNSWVYISRKGAPSARFGHTAVWTGTEMIIWGGFSSFTFRRGLNDGGRYNQSTNSWNAISSKGAPERRARHTAIWTGKQMVIWGGCSPDRFDPDLFFCRGINTGGRYDPNTNSWVATTKTHAPKARLEHTAIWTGKQMIVWGGRACDFFCGGTNTGGRYNPSTNSWVSTSIKGAPSVRFWNTAVWTGKEMIVWGGFLNLKTGGRYSPSNTWKPTAQ
jgi:N-acetylneuraminic acid mutarotase